MSSCAAPDSSPNRKTNPEQNARRTPGKKSYEDEDTSEAKTEEDDLCGNRPGTKKQRLGRGPQKGGGFALAANLVASDLVLH